MAVSPDDRFAGLIHSSAERGGWVPGDVFASDSEGEEEPVETRRVRLPILVALVVAAMAVIVIGFLLVRPATQHAVAEHQVGSVEGRGTDNGTDSDNDTDNDTDSGGGAGTTATRVGEAPGQGKDPAADAAREPQGTAPVDIIVHVTGAVRRPSVVTLTAGARVQDAVEEAGGLTAQADAEAINLARVLQDGEQIHIPARGEEQEPGRADSDSTAANSAGSAGASSAGGSAASASGNGAPDSDAGAKVDLNTADRATLETLPGVGPVTAEAIIVQREEQAYTSIEDLLLVQGIGPKTFENLKDRVSVG